MLHRSHVLRHIQAKVDFLEGNAFYFLLYLYFNGISCYHKTWNISQYWYGKYEFDDTLQVFKPQIVNRVIFG